MADTRVSQAGRQAATQEGADARVSQAGRQAATQEGADARVSQAGRQVAAQRNATLRVTQMGRFVLITEPAPTRPNLVNPVDAGTYATTLAIVYDPSIDPLGGAIEYHARYKLTTDTIWTDIFTGRTSEDAFVHDISGDADGTYDFEMWATTAGYSSQKNAIEFTIHNGIPTAPEITAPVEGQKWQQEVNTVEWEAATDPDDDPLTYSGRYRAVGDTVWTNLFGPQSGLTYAWDQTALAVDDYELQVWANDGTGDGPADQVFFSIFIADQPVAPRIRIVEVGANYVTAELYGYEHPFDRPWQATNWQMIPFGGDWSNPVVDYTTTDATEQLLYTIHNLPPGFVGMVRARFQDDVGTWGEFSTEALFRIPAETNLWVRRAERNAEWLFTGLDIEGRSGDWSHLGPGPHPQPVSAIADPDSELIGSALIEGYMMAGGCYCGFIGRDTELQMGGIGIFLGDSLRGPEEWLIFGIDFGTADSTHGIAGAHFSRPVADAQFDGCAVYGGDHKTVLGGEFTGYSQVIEGVTPQFGQPIGPWLSEYTHWPVYKLELWIQRNIANDTSRVRGRINYQGFFSSSFPEALLDRKTAAGDQWDIDFTFDCSTVCGLPGFWRQHLAYGWPSAFIQFYGLKYTALRDEGLQVAFTREPLLPFVEPLPETCAPVAEDPLPAPIFFPCPPNGNVKEGWVQPSDVIVARDDSEQRVSLRDIPVEVIEFTTTLPTSVELGQLKALLYEHQPSRWGVPMWMDAATLDSIIPSGSGTIPAGSFEWSTRRFEEMDYVAIWVDQFTWDFLPATLNPDGSVTLDGTTSQQFDAHKTQIIPCRIGRIPSSLDFDRDAPEIGDVRVTFVLEAVDHG